MFSTVNEIKLEEVTNKLFVNLKKVFNNEITCFLLHGSVIKGGFIKGFSDMDVQVFLSESVFDEYGIPIDKAMKIQELINEIDLHPIEAYYLQVYFYNPNKMPKWYASPLIGTYKIIYGQLPKEVFTPIEVFQEKIGEIFNDLPSRIANQIRSFADSKNDELFRRVRYLSTDVIPTIYSMLSYNINKPEIIWSKPKDEVIALFKEKFDKEIFTIYLDNFFNNIQLMIQNKENNQFTRKAMFYGFNFLKEIVKFISDKI